MERAAECPRCQRLRATEHEQTARCCGRCFRWQSLYQAAFITFGGAVYRHLACVACGQAAWCRDMLEGPDATGCSYYGHVHPPGQCPGGF